jgi:hypothetical protein
MNEFYSKKDKKPRVPKFGTNSLPKKKKSKGPTLPTFTVEEMMKTVNTSEGVDVDIDFGSLSNTRRTSNFGVNHVSDTGGQRTKRKSNQGFKSNNSKKSFGSRKMKATFGKSLGGGGSKTSRDQMTSPYGNVRKKKKEKMNDNQIMFDNRFDRASSLEKKDKTIKNAEFMMMRSDLNDYKQKVSNNDDINKFQQFLKGDMEGVEEEEDSEYMSENGMPQMDMKDAIKYMTREERQEYLKQKKLKRKKKFEDEMKKKNSFKPKINKKSKAIDNNRTKNMRFKRHDLLFGLNTVLKQREEQLKEVIEAERFMKYAQEELNECTFHPRINRMGPSTVNEGSIAERTKAFMEKKKRKQMNHDRIKKINETKDCTFTPKINQGIKGKKFY